MMSKKHAITGWPVPLKDKPHGLGEVARAFVSETQETHSESAAYARVRILTQPSRRPLRRVPRIAVGLAMASLLVMAGAALYREVSRDPRPNMMAAGSSPARRESRSAQTPTRVPPPSGRPVPSLVKATAVRLASAPVSLPAGHVDLAGQASLVLAADTAATARAQAESTEIALKAGSIDLDVEPRAPGQGFSVRAGSYRFMVVGTSFTVNQTRTRLELLVREGTVAVWRSENRLALVHAGQTWAADLVASPSATGMGKLDSTEREGANSAQPDVSTVVGTAAPPPSLIPPPPVPSAAPQASPSAPFPTSASQAKEQTPAFAGISCAELATRRELRQALACYQERASQNGLTGETAQYELGRLWRDSFGDSQHALASFQEQRSRFPHGALRIEADLSIIELLPRLGRHSEALAETERFLATHPKSERRGEIHLLRGNIFREGLHDLRQAEREYALGAEVSGHAGDDCRFLHAVCAEALGHSKEARAEYRAYLLQRGGAHTAEAKKHLDVLGP
jgi:tetratricopeptide (TPR) repeat protein